MLKKLFLTGFPEAIKFLFSKRMLLLKMKMCFTPGDLIDGSVKKKV
jgi:hypothetical protein